MAKEYAKLGAVPVISRNAQASSTVLLNFTNITDSATTMATPLEFYIARVVTLADPTLYTEFIKPKLSGTVTVGSSTMQFNSKTLTSGESTFITTVTDGGVPYSIYGAFTFDTISIYAGSWAEIWKDLSNPKTKFLSGTGFGEWSATFTFPGLHLTTPIKLEMSEGIVDNPDTTTHISVDSTNLPQSLGGSVVVSNVSVTYNTSTGESQLTLSGLKSGISQINIFKVELMTGQSTEQRAYSATLTSVYDVPATSELKLIFSDLGMTPVEDYSPTVTTAHSGNLFMSTSGSAVTNVKHIMLPNTHSTAEDWSMSHSGTNFPTNTVLTAGMHLKGKTIGTMAGLGNDPDNPTRVYGGNLMELTMACGTATQYTYLIFGFPSKVYYIRHTKSTVGSSWSQYVELYHTEYKSSNIVATLPYINCNTNAAIYHTFVKKGGKVVWQVTSVDSGDSNSNLTNFKGNYFAQEVNIPEFNGDGNSLLNSNDYVELRYGYNNVQTWGSYFAYKFDGTIQ